jgi:hypothetical protein
MPLVIANATRGASVSKTGRINSVVIALTSTAMEIVFSGPIKSHKNPERSRPIAVRELEPVNKPAPVLDGSPSEYRKKERRDESAKVVTAPAKKTLRKEKSQNAIR